MKVLTSYFGFPFLSHGSFCDSFKVLFNTEISKTGGFTLQTQWPAVRTYLLLIKEPPHKASMGLIQILATQGCIHNLKVGKGLIRVKATLEFLAL